MKLCRRGHAGPRYKDGKCVPCVRAYYAANKERFNAQATAWARTHRERMSELTRSWQKRNAERDQARKVAYRKSDVGKSRERASSRAWQKANAARCVANVQRRDALKRNAPGCGVTPDEWQGTLDASLGLCAYCNGRGKLTMDHIDPLILGGAHDVENIGAVCSTCNCRKNDKPLLLWLATRGTL